MEQTTTQEKIDDILHEGDEDDGRKTFVDTSAEDLEMALNGEHWLGFSFKQELAALMDYIIGQAAALVCEGCPIPGEEIFEEHDCVATNVLALKKSYKLQVYKDQRTREILEWWASMFGCWLASLFIGGSHEAR